MLLVSQNPSRFPSILPTNLAGGHESCKRLNCDPVKRMEEKYVQARIEIPKHHH